MFSNTVQPIGLDVKELTLMLRMHGRNHWGESERVQTPKNLDGPSQLFT